MTVDLLSATLFRPESTPRGPGPARADAAAPSRPDLDRRADEAPRREGIWSAISRYLRTPPGAPASP